MLGFRQLTGDQEALVVGANLTGLALCCALQAQGVRTRPLAAPREDPFSDFVYLHPSTLERFHAIGLLPRLLAHGRPLHAINVYTSESRVARVPLRVVKTPFPYILALPGAQLEQALLDHGALGPDGRLATHVDTTAKPRGMRVTARTKTGRNQRLRARWMMQCAPEIANAPDGGFALDGVLEWDFPSDERYLFVHNGGLCSVQAGPRQRVRLAFDRPPPAASDLKQFVQSQIPFACRLSDLSTPRMLPRLTLSPALGHGPMFRVDTQGMFPAVLCGDQINAGVQRAFNLAWKLGLTKRGFARPELLASYDVECRELAKPLVATRLGEALMHMQDRDRRSVRDCLAGLDRLLDGRYQPVLRALHQLAPHLPPGPLLEDVHTPLLQSRLRSSEASETASLRERRLFAQAPMAGMRAPDCTIVRDQPTLLERLAGPLHTLLLFDGHAPTPAGYRNLVEIARTIEARYGDLIRVHVVVPMARMPTTLAQQTGRWRGAVIFDQDSKLHHLFGAHAECLYLIRPDGFIGFRSQPAEKSSLLDHIHGFLL